MFFNNSNPSYERAVSLVCVSLCFDCEIKTLSSVWTASGFQTLSNSILSYKTENLKALKLHCLIEMSAKDGFEASSSIHKLGQHIAVSAGELILQTIRVHFWGPRSGALIEELQSAP